MKSQRKKKIQDAPSSFVSDTDTYQLSKSTSYLPSTLSYAAFKVILDTHALTVAEWASLLQLSERTMHRFAKENLSFNALESERIALLHQALLQANQLFGNTTKQWLLGHSYGFNGLQPIQYLYTHAGIMHVQRVLTNIQYGVVV
ncbi:MAG: hypothetical protein RL660_374 [Bacteroidota bacterium]|jgi:putative toxin-antitoxin system antitoxin component (TIGR02293 family)